MKEYKEGYMRGFRGRERNGEIMQYNPKKSLKISLCFCLFSSEGDFTSVHRGEKRKSHDLEIDLDIVGCCELSGMGVGN